MSTIQYRSKYPSFVYVSPWKLKMKNVKITIGYILISVGQALRKLKIRRPGNKNAVRIQRSLSTRSRKRLHSANSLNSGRKMLYLDNVHYFM